MISLLVLAASLALAAPVAPGDSARADRDIRQSALRHARDIRRCYESEGLTRNPALAGTIDVELTILPTGVVSRVGVEASRLEGPGVAELSACVSAAVRNWRFLRGPFVVERVVFPFHLVPERVLPPPRIATRS